MAEIAKPEAAPQDHPITTLGILAPIVGWLVPGGGHFLLKKHTRGAILATCVLSMFGLGLWMQGKIYAPNTGDLLDMLGFLGDVGNGSLYILARIFDWGHGAVELAAADYGTKFIIVAGLLNVISAVDAHHIAIGKKS